MTILERLDSRIDNDIQEECFKQDLKRIVRELLPLRASEYKTQDYCQNYLYTEHKDPEELLPGAIDRDLAPIFRSALLSVIKEDKDTFGYLYYRLTCEYNNCHPWGKDHPITDNIPHKDNIWAALEKEKLPEAPTADKGVETPKEKAVKIFKQYPKAWDILEKAQEKGFFDEDFNIPKETRHEQLGIFAYEFCRKMKNAPFSDNGTNYALFERLFGLKVGTLGKAYREGKNVNFGGNPIKIKKGKYGGRYIRAQLIINFFKHL
ncbi:MAG TPA: hypothetical protein PL032_13710 [Syntrophorhabdus sp.]|nr:hypothetical protein [Syntrophorhabdus sp.]